MGQWTRRLIAASAAAVCLAGQGAGEPAQLATGAAEQGADRVEDESIGLRSGNFVVVPVPFSSPVIGAGLAFGGGYLFKSAPEARTSVLGLAGMRSENGSNAYGALVKLALGENRWLLDLFAGVADLRYDLSIGPAEIPLEQTGDLVNLGFAYGVTPQLSFGTVIRYLDTDVGLGLGRDGVLPTEILPDANLELVTLALTADWDLRDDTDYPTKGVRLYAEAIQGAALNADERRYQKAFGRLDGFYPVLDSAVLAARAVACRSSADTPFFDKCSLGLTDNFRGYSGTQFLDDRLFSLQAEYRQRFTKRIGGVAFAGVGWTGADNDAARDAGAKSAAGVGLRYRVSRDFPVDLSVDISRNDDGEEFLYIFVGQRF